jgi:WD40 repeat protein/tRNA A-37 threonylcarbamoyl transferase component Bud32
MADPDLCGRTLGEFDLRERIDEDSSGAWYRGEQPLLGRDVVIKVLHQRHDADALQRFEREAQLASRLDHPYAAHVYAFGVECEDDLPWIAMELVQGITLKRWLQTHGSMTLALFVPFFECIAEVVQAAHERGIEHLDLKPSNVMVIEGAGRLIPKLLGFGIDRLTGSDAGMARAADIHALGVLAYEALTGHAYDRDAPVPPLGDDFSPELDRILQRALAKAPEDRHGDVLELASELRAALRTSEPEQLRSLAQQWEDRGRPRGLLLRGDMLADFAHGTRGRVLSELECSLLADSQRHVRRNRWVRRSLLVLAFAGLLAAVEYRAATKTWTAQQLVTQAELEQGRSALIHNEPEAGPHLAEAYQRDHSPSTAFMLARALQPRLAEQARFASSAGRMWSAAFSPDGKQIVTTDDKSARVWDAQTHRLLFTLAHGDTVYHAVYGADGTKIITAGGDGSVGIWDAADGSSVRKLVQPRRDGKPSRYVVVALSPEGELVAAIDLLGEVAHVWAAGTGAPLAELRNDASRFASLAFSADGRWLATSGGNDVRVFDAGTWTQALMLAGPRIHSLAFDPTGPRLVTGSASGDAAIWAIPGGERLHHLRDVGEPIDAVAFSPDGKLIVTGNHDGAEQIWDAGSGVLRSQLNPRHSPILSVEFDRASKLVLAASSDGAVVVADAALGMPVTVLDGPANIMAAHFDPSSRLVVGASLDGTARVWDVTPPYRRWSSPPISDDCGIITSREPDRRFMAVGCRDHDTRVWDTLHDQLLADLPSVTQIDGDWPSVFPAVSVAGDRAAIARGNAVELYELPGRRLLRAIPHLAAVNTVAFASAGHDLVSGAVDGSLLVARDGRDPIALPASPDGIDAAGFLADGRVVAAAGKRLRVYDADRTAVLADLEVPSRVMSLRPSLDGRRLITIPSYSGTPAPPVLWDLEQYRIVALLEGHVGRVFSARFVGDGLLTTGEDRTVRLWDGATGRLRQTYRGDVSSRFLADATLSPDGAMVVAGGGDGLLWFWDVADERPIWKLPAHRSHLVGLHFEGADIVTRGFAGDVSRWTLPNPEQVIKTCGDREACAIVAR